MKKVIIESPYRGDRYRSLETNKAYLREAIKDSLNRDEAPYASHALYPGILDDTIEEQREKGLLAGWAWYTGADACALYVDVGISEGMERGVFMASGSNIPIHIRSLANIGDIHRMFVGLKGSLELLRYREIHSSDLEVIYKRS